GLEDLGQTNIVQHYINMGSTSPIKQAAYRLAPSEQEFLQEEKINTVTKKDAYPIPRINDILETFENASWFSSLDLASGYWQVSIAEQNREKTAFVTKFGVYEFNVMPFSLCNAPATFQRLMNHVLKEYIGQFVAVYLDDITVYSRTFWEHMKHLKRKENRPEEAREAFKVDVISIEDSEDKWYSENEDYKENYEDEGNYEFEVEEMDYESTDSIEEQWNTWEMDESEVVNMNRREQGYEQLLHDFEVESGSRLLWEGHSDIAQQWAIQGEESFSDITRMEWEHKKNVPWSLTPEEVIEASEEENNPKYEGDEESSDDDDESQIEVVINSGSTSLTTPEEETLTEEWKEETFEPQAIDIGAEGIGIEKDERLQKLVFAGKTQRFENEFFLYDHSTLNDHIAARELNLSEAVYW
ncbi:19391_t:CDS:2, partial [Dentiscutata erythropus]